MSIVPTDSDRQINREELARALAAERALASAPVSLDAISGAELYDKQYPPREFIVDGLIKRGDLVLLAGRPKSGKSWLLLQMAQAVDTGARFLGRETARAKVLFIALEDGERRVHERLHIRGWRPAEAHFAFDLFPLGGAGLQQLKYAAQAFDVVIVDTLRTALGGMDENDNSQMGWVVQSLADFAHDADKVVVVSHHTRKGDATDAFELIRGAGAIRAAYDVGMLIQRKEKEPEAVLRFESRDLQIEDMTIHFDPETGWRYEGDARRIEEIRAGRRVVQALAELGDAQTADAIAEHLGISKQAAWQQLTKAERDGLVKRRTEHVDGARKPRDLWYLAQMT